MILLTNLSQSMNQVDEATSGFLMKLADLFANSAIYRNVLSTFPAPLNDIYISLFATIILVVFFGIWIYRAVSGVIFNVKMLKKDRKLEEERRIAAKRQLEREEKEMEMEHKERQRRYEMDKRADERYEREEKRKIDTDRRADARIERQDKNMDNFIRFVMQAKKIGLASQFLTLEQFEEKQQVYNRYIEEFPNKTPEQIAYDVEGKWRNLEPEEKKLLADKEAERLYQEKMEQATAEAEAEKQRLVEALKQEVEKNEQLRSEHESALAAQAETLNAKIVAAQAERKSELEQAQAEADKANEHINLLKEQISQQQSIMKEITDKNTSIEKQLVQANSSNEEQLAKIESLTAALEQARKQAGELEEKDNPLIAILQEQLESAKASISEQNNIVSKLTGELEESNAKYEDIKNQMEQKQQVFQAYVQQAEEKLARLNTKNMEQEKISASEDAQLAKAQLEIVQAKLAHSEAEKSEKEKLLNIMNSPAIPKQVSIVTPEEISEEVIKEHFVANQTAAIKEAEEKAKLQFCTMNGTNPDEMNEFEKIMQGCSKREESEKERKEREQKEREQAQARKEQMEAELNAEKQKSIIENNNSKVVTFDDEAIEKNLVSAQRQKEKEEAAKNKKKLFSGIFGGRNKKENPVNTSETDVYEDEEI